MRKKISLTLWYDVSEKLPPKSGVYLCNDGYGVMALTYSAKHKAFGVTDSVPDDKVDWCRMHPTEWAEMPDFVETVMQNVTFELLVSIEHNLHLGMDYLSEATKLLSLIKKEDE